MSASAPGDPGSWLGPGPLNGDRVVLRPLVIDDAPSLAQVVDDPARFAWTTVPTDLAAAEQFVRTAESTSNRTAFAVIDTDAGQLVGTTSYYDIDPASLCVAIGYTFYADAAQGTVINPASKFLLLQHAFEVGGAVRVVWHTHERNAQSRAAIAKLGARFEGLLRKHRRWGDGWRTTAQYAMTDDDWPTAKQVLLDRIGASPGC